MNTTAVPGKARQEFLELHDDDCSDNLSVCSSQVIRRKTTQTALNFGMTLQSKEYPAGQNWRQQDFYCRSNGRSIREIRRLHQCELEDSQGEWDNFQG